MLKLENVTVDIGTKNILKNVSLDVEKGRVLGVVGESGSGKTMSMLFALGLLPSAANIVGGKAYLDDRCLTDLTEKEMSQVRGCDIAMIFQEPMTSLNPTMKIGRQVEEVILLHEKVKDKALLRKRVIDALSEVLLPEPEKLYDKYPHELSGGMRQRVMIAMGCILRPDYLICDEPTTALDVVTQGEIIKLIKQLKTTRNMGIVFITHNLKLLKDFADEIAVMCDGCVVERGDWQHIFMKPEMEYTKKLIMAIPNRQNRKRETNGEPSRD